jgi:GlpG protein
MRQVGTLASERDAQRFAAWLVAQQIEAHAEQEANGWAVWVREEDQLPKAREALAEYQANPLDAKYQNSERTAQEILRQEAEKRRQAQSNVVEMHRRWGAGSAFGGGVPRRCPLVLALIGISILVFIASDRGRQDTNPVKQAMVFVNENHAAAAEGSFDYWASIRRGEVWRLVTPIFLHFSMWHLAFNMLCLWDFGGQIENRRGSRAMAVLLLVLAVASNVGQAVEMSALGSTGAFGGMSGVDYGVFGYVLVKAKFDARERYSLSPATTFIAILWFVLCIARDHPPFHGWIGDTIPRVANTAHAVGFFLGMAIAYAPLLVRKPA